jgi:hypothetical protein
VQRYCGGELITMNRIREWFLKASENNGIKIIAGFLSICLIVTIIIGTISIVNKASKERKIAKEYGLTTQELREIQDLGSLRDTSGNYMYATDDIAYRTHRDPYQMWMILNALNSISRTRSYSSYSPYYSSPNMSPYSAYKTYPNNSQTVSPTVKSTIMPSTSSKVEPTTAQKVPSTLKPTEAPSTAHNVEANTVQKTPSTAKSNVEASTAPKVSAKALDKTVPKATAKVTPKTAPKTAPKSAPRVSPKVRHK